MPETDSISTTCSRPAPREPQWTEQQHLVYLLQDRDTRCPRCGRSLRGLEGNRCSRCSSELALSLSLAAPNLRAWIIAMGSLCLSAGLGVFFLIVVFEEGWPHEVGARWVCIQASLVYFILSIPCAAAIVALRQRYQRLAATMQRRLAALAVVSTGLALALLIGFFWSR